MAEYYAKPAPYPHPPPQPDGRVEPRPAEMPEHAHEGTDVNIRPLVITGAVLVGSLITTVVLLVFLFKYFSGQTGDERAPSAVRNVTVEVPQPRLQGIPDPGFNTAVPRVEMEAWRKMNENALTTYSKADAEGFARIPVNRAMDLALQQNLFKIAPPATEAASQGERPDDSSPPRRQEQKAPQRDEAPQQNEGPKRDPASAR